MLTSGSESDPIPGNTGVVQGLHRDAAGKLTFAVRLESDIKSDEGRIVVVDAANNPNLAYAYASTVHKAQGQGKAEVRQLANPGMTGRQLSLVAFTRQKSTYTIFGADNDVDPGTLAERLRTDRLRVNALDVRKPVLKPVPTSAMAHLRPSRTHALKAADAQAEDLEQRSLYDRAKHVMKAIVQPLEKHQALRRAIETQKLKHEHKLDIGW